MNSRLLNTHQTGATSLEKCERTRGSEDDGHTLPHTFQTQHANVAVTNPENTKGFSFCERIELSKHREQSRTSPLPPLIFFLTSIQSSMLPL